MNLDRLKTTAGIDVNGKRVLVRADLNVPASEGKVTDATRLERLIPGLKDLAQRGARVIVISHFGRPKVLWPDHTAPIPLDDIEALLPPGGNDRL